MGSLFTESRALRMFLSGLGGTFASLLWWRNSMFDSIPRRT